MSAQCYKYDGSPATNTSGWTACDSKAAVTNCCNKEDFCTSSGICMNAIGDNFFSMQGCTRQDWQGCVRACNGTQYSNPEGLASIQVCGLRNQQNNIQYCCGDSAECCSDTKNLQTVAIATNFFHPNSTVGAPVTITVTSTPTGTAGSGNGSGDDTADNKSLIIGAAVGVPLGLALIAAIFFLGWQTWKKNKSANAQFTPVPTSAIPETVKYSASPSVPATSTYNHSSYAPSYMQQAQRSPAEMYGEQQFELPGNGGSGFGSPSTR